METATPPANDAQEQNRLARLQLANDFLAVFGPPGQRTPNQERVLAHLEKDAGEESNAFQFQGLSDGLSIALAAAHRDGAQSRIRIINRQVRSAITPAQAKPKTGKVKRQRHHE